MITSVDIFGKIKVSRRSSLLNLKSLVEGNEETIIHKIGDREGIAVVLFFCLKTKNPEIIYMSVRTYRNIYNHSEVVLA